MTELAGIRGQVSTANAELAKLTSEDEGGLFRTIDAINEGVSKITSADKESILSLVQKASKAIEDLDTKLTPEGQDDLPTIISKVSDAVKNVNEGLEKVVSVEKDSFLDTLRANLNEIKETVEGFQDGVTEMSSEEDPNSLRSAFRAGIADVAALMRQVENAVATVTSTDPGSTRADMSSAMGKFTGLGDTFERISKHMAAEEKRLGLPDARSMMDVITGASQLLRPVPSECVVKKVRCFTSATITAPTEIFGKPHSVTAFSAKIDSGFIQHAISSVSTS